MTNNPAEVLKRILFIVNDAPYGIKRLYNAMRLAMNLSKRPGVTVSTFMVGDGVLCAKKGRKTSDG